MKKHIANILSGIRILIAIVLLDYNEITLSFLKLFCAAGLTDLLDGPVARYTKSVSVRGAVLDTSGDILTYVAVVRILTIKGKIKRVFFAVAGCAAIAILVSAFIGLARLGKFYFVHTATSKALGLGGFLMPFSYYLETLEAHLPVLCGLLAVLAIESLIIQSRATTPDPDVKTVFSIK